MVSENRVDPWGRKIATKERGYRLWVYPRVLRGR